MPAIVAADEWQTELRSRRDALAAILEQAGCDLGLVFGTLGRAEHLRYLTGFAPGMGDGWILVRAADEPSGFLDFNWQVDDARRRSGFDWQAQFTAAPLVAEALAAERPGRIGVAGLDRVPVEAYEAIRSRVPGVELVDVGAELAKSRRCKSPLEVRLLREAARRTDQAFEAARREAKAGVTEEDLAARLGYALGPEWSFAPCVISGLDDPVPIREPTDRPIEGGDTVMIDIGAAFEGYQADASRTLVIGSPSPLQLEVWDAVRRAYGAAVAAARPGVPCVDVQQVAERVLEDAGFGLAHRIGHGIGLATSFEWPSLDRDSEPLEPGMTICVEPAVCLDGVGVMKLEDDLLITEDGCELLTTSPAELRAG